MFNHVRSKERTESPRAGCPILSLATIKTISQEDSPLFFLSNKFSWQQTVWLKQGRGLGCCVYLLLFSCALNTALRFLWFRGKSNNYIELSMVQR